MVEINIKETGLEKAEKKAALQKIADCLTLDNLKFLASLTSSSKVNSVLSSKMNRTLIKSKT